MNKRFDYCIVGAGPSGLTAAYKLLQEGKSVVVVERNDRIGGLAKSYDYDGQIFDIGPKRFHTDDQVVLDFIDEVLRGDVYEIERSTKVYFLGRYFDWPLHSKDVLKMPLGVSIRCFLELLQKREIQDTSSFHQFVYQKYGETLYQIFFKPYTQKFLRWDPEDIHSDWASTGINRTVIDKRVKSNSLSELVKGLMLPAKIDTKFLYPTEGGFGGFYEKLVALCARHEDFEVITGDQVAGLTPSGDHLDAVTGNGTALSFGELIWTGNLNDLCRLAGSEHRLPYLNTVFYNLICREEGISSNKAQWIYVSKGDSLISRITCMKEFAPYTCRDGYSNIICELTDSQASPVYFADPASYKDGILKELEEMSFLKNSRYAEDVRINPVVDTYPIYHSQYNKDFGRAVQITRKFSSRVHLLGRCGAFWYNNSDHSIRFAIELVNKLLKKNTGEFDYRAYFGGTQARAADPRGA